MKTCVSFFSFAIRPVAAGMLATLLVLGNPPIAQADTYELGLKMYEAGEYPMAARYLRQAVEENDANPNAHYYLADTYIKLNQLAEAQAEYQKILALAPNSQAARLSRVGLGRLRAILDQPSGQAQGLRWKRNGSGTGSMQDRYSGPPPGDDHYLDEVTQGGRIIRWSLAKTPLKVYIEHSPSGIRNFQPAFISQVQRSLDVWTRALNQQLTFTLVNAPEQADIRISWINTINTKGHSVDGGTAYTAGITSPRIDNDQLQYMDIKLATFDIEGKPQTADIIYAVAIHEVGHGLGLLGHSEDPGDIMNAMNQDVSALSKRDVNTIRKLYSAMADLDNMPAASRQKDAQRQQELAEKQDEGIARQEALVAKDNNVLNWINLGVLYSRKGHLVSAEGRDVARPWFDKAVKAFDEAIKLEPKEPRAYHRRSLAYQELGNYNQALQDIRQAISFDRKEAEYYLLEGWYLANLGQNGLARNSLDTYLLYNPKGAGSPEAKRLQELLAGNKAAK